MNPFQIAMQKLSGPLFNLMVKKNRQLKLPAMNPDEIAIYKKLLQLVKSNQKIQIFEYGTGYSTLYFAKYLKKNNFDFHIHSIDNHKGWHEEVIKMVKKEGLEDNISLYLSEFSPFWEKEGWDWKQEPLRGKFAPTAIEEIKYIHKPVQLGLKFDFISVDARFRRRCLEVIPVCLSEQGVVFLHDAQWTKYQPSFSIYKYSKLIKTKGYFPFDQGNWQVWVGSMDNSRINEIKI